MEVVNLGIQPLRNLDAAKQDAAARTIIGNIIAKGDIVLATHALTFLGYYPDPSLKPALVSRRLTLGSSWPENQFRLSVDTYLAKIGDANGQKRLADYMINSDSTLRSRTYRALRDIDPTEFPKEIQEQIKATLIKSEAVETDLAAKSAANSALVCWDQENADAYIDRLTKTSEGTDKRAGFRAAIELNQLRNWGRELKTSHLKVLDSQIDAKLPEDESGFRNELMTAAQKGPHAERMFSLELLAQLGDKKIDKIMKAQGADQLWQSRLSSAFYLLLINDKLEARKRLLTENQPFVQLALLCTIISADH